MCDAMEGCYTPRRSHRANGHDKEGCRAGMEARKDATKGAGSGHAQRRHGRRRKRACAKTPRKAQESGQEEQDGAQSQQGHSAKTNREQGADGENAGRLMMEVVTV